MSRLVTRVTPTLDGSSVQIGDGEVRARALRIEAGAFDTPFWLVPDGDESRAVRVDALPWQGVIRAGSVRRLSEAPGGAVLGTILDLAVVSVTATTITVTWSDVEGATTYQPAFRETGVGEYGNFGSAIDPEEETATFTGLTEDQAYDLVVVASDGSATTTSNVVVGTPVVSGGAEPFFEDDFANGQKNNANGFEWTGGMPVVLHEGDYGLRFRYGPDADGEDSSREQKFTLDQFLSEVWIEYDILYPLNYVHRSQSPANNKFFQLNQEGGGGGLNLMTVESERQGGASSLRRFLSESDLCAGGNNWPTGTPGQSNFIGDGEEFAIQLGVRTRVGLYYRASSGCEVQNGRMEVWVGGVLFNGLHWATWDADHSGAIDGGYFMGWSNSGFSDETDIYVYDVKFYDEPPPWWSED